MDFIASAFNMVTNFAARCRYRTGISVPLVLRGPAGSGVRAGPFHSQNPEAHFAHIPGIKVVAPASVADAAGLLRVAIRDEDPVLFLEHKRLYRSLRIRESEFRRARSVVPLGTAAVRRRGRDLTLAAYGGAVGLAVEVAERLARDGVRAEVLDLRCLVPLDRQALLASVRRTNRLIVVHEANLTGGFGGEIAALAGEHAFDFLDAPVVRVAAADTPVPYAPELEDAVLPSVPGLHAGGPPACCVIEVVGRGPDWRRGRSCGPAGRPPHGEGRVPGPGGPGRGTPEEERSARPASERRSVGGTGRRS